MRRAFHRTSLLALASALVVGCGDGTFDPRHPGTPLGDYHVDAEREITTCGENALGSPATWEFAVRLSKGEGLLYWDNGAAIVEGTLGSDARRFSFETSIAVDMRGGGSPSSLPPCMVVRLDRVEGLLDADESGFSGELAYEFSPAEGSSCEDLVTGEMPSFAALPCVMTYVLSATRTSTSP